MRPAKCDADERFTFGALLRRHRVAAGLTQEALAERAQVSARAISDLERGARNRPWRDTVQLLADALHLEAAQRATLEAAARRLSSPPGGDPETGVRPTTPCPRHNLPAPLNSFVGRERELAEVTRLLAETRLLTLTGTGGCGKTRLALRLGETVLDEFADGVWLVELASLADPALVPQVVASVLGIREVAGVPLLQTLADRLRSKRLVLLLDNCEHLIDAAAALADVLTRRCPSLRVLATSRERLGIPGELAWRCAGSSRADQRL